MITLEMAMLLEVTAALVAGLVGFEIGIKTDSRRKHEELKRLRHKGKKRSEYGFID